MAEYEVAERTFELEIRKQYPDLQIGPGYGLEDGQDQVLMGLSLPLPVLNANRQAIARAEANRSVARASVEAALERLTPLELDGRFGAVGGAGLLTLLSLALATTFGTSFLPAFKEGTFTVFLMAPPGTSLAESNRLALGIESRLADIEGIQSVTRRTGRAERDEHAEPVSSSEVEVTMKPGADQELVRASIDRIIANIPGVTTMIGQPIEHRLSHVLSGTPAAIAINVYGEDLNTLRTLAKDIEAQLRAIPGTRDVAANREVMITSLPIRYRPQDLAAAGLSPGAAAEQVQQALYGETVAEVSQGVRRYEMVVRLAPIYATVPLRTCA